MVVSGAGRSVLAPGSGHIKLCSDFDGTVRPKMELGWDEMGKSRRDVRRFCSYLSSICEVGVGVGVLGFLVESRAGDP